MTPNIQAVIDQLTQEITLRQDIITQLQKVFALPAIAAPQQTQPAKTPKQRVQPLPVNGASRPPKKQTVGLQARIMEVLPVCVSPFDGVLVHAALGDNTVTVTQVQNCLRYAANTGKLKLVTEGRPGFAAKYALKGRAASAAARPAPAARPTQPAQSIEQKIAAALKQRDHARSEGRESIAQMFQDQIDTLQAQLA
jgi:hypothetical protein